MTRALVLVSNRGPVTYGADGSVQRGTGGLVTALSGLASYRELIWIASAMTEHDAAVSHRHGGRAFEVSSPAGGDYLVRLVESAPEAYDRFYSIFANPMLWFIQHYLWDLSNAPDIRRNEIEAFEFGYNVVNEDLARAVVEEIEGVENPVVMVHDYHLYTLPELVRRARPDVFLHHFVHIPWTQPDAWRVLPTRIRQELYARPARQRHHRLPHPVLPAQLPAVLPRAGRRGDRRPPQRRVLGGARGLGPRVPAADRPRRHAGRRAASPRRRVPTRRGPRHATARLRLRPAAIRHDAHRADPRQPSRRSTARARSRWPGGASRKSPSCSVGPMSRWAVCPTWTPRSSLNSPGGTSIGCANSTEVVPSGS